MKQSRRLGYRPVVELLEDLLTPSGAGHSAPVALDNTVTSLEDTPYTFQVKKRAVKKMGRE